MFIYSGFWKYHENVPRYVLSNLRSSFGVKCMLPFASIRAIKTEDRAGTKNVTKGIFDDWSEAAFPWLSGLPHVPQVNKCFFCHLMPMMTLLYTHWFSLFKTQLKLIHFLLFSLCYFICNDPRFFPIFSSRISYLRF